MKRKPATESKPRGWMNLCGIDRFFILGAGFSAPAGMPLGNSLFPEVYRAAASETFGDTGEPCSQQLLEDLRLFYPTKRVSRSAFDSGVFPKTFDFEDFMSCVAAVSACEDGTKNQWDEHGNQSLSWLKRWLGMAISSSQKEALGSIPDFYHTFAKSLVGNKVAFTFNWDTILECLLEKQKVEYVLDGRHSFRSGTMNLFKLHGSIDWFSRDISARGIPLESISPALGDICRARLPFCQLGRCFDANITPWIVCPSYDKMHQLKKFGQYWDMLYLLFQNGGVLTIVGYSMRPDDYHTRAIIYPQLVQASRRFGLQVRVVDYASSERERNKIRRKYAGVRDVRFWFEGFGEESLNFIFE